VLLGPDVVVGFVAQTATLGGVAYPLGRARAQSTDAGSIGL
jgi:hypothetical protein